MGNKGQDRLSTAVIEGGQDFYINLILHLGILMKYPSWRQRRWRVWTAWPFKVHLALGPQEFAKWGTDESKKHSALAIMFAA